MAKFNKGNIQLHPIVDEWLRLAIAGERGFGKLATTKGIVIVKAITDEHGNPVSAIADKAQVRWKANHLSARGALTFRLRAGMQNGRARWRGSQPVDTNGKISIEIPLTERGAGMAPYGENDSTFIIDPVKGLGGESVRSRAYAQNFACYFDVLVGGAMPAQCRLRPSASGLAVYLDDPSGKSSDVPINVSEMEFALFKKLCCSPKGIRIESRFLLPHGTPQRVRDTLKQLSKRGDQQKVLLLELIDRPTRKRRGYCLKAAAYVDAAS